MVLIKLGGSILEDEQSICQISHDCKKMLDSGVSLILVHGGGKAINRALAAKNISSTFWEGLRITTAEMMEVIEKVLFGEVNQKLVSLLNSAGVPAIGISGVDGKLILCSVLDSRLGYVGRIEKINIPLYREFR
jgi:acetylglutamate kinase